MPALETHLYIKENKIRNRAVYTLKTKQPFMPLLLFNFILSKYLIYFYFVFYVTFKEW